MKNRTQEPGARRTRVLLAASGAVTVLTTAGVLTAYAFSGRIAAFLPHATWFVALFVILGVLLLLLMQWIARRFDL